ncbi:DinB family protein [Paenibacillus sp. N1-5-1-14]|uniref:DinB family protein n=1 Tax=Paenibacillus radicibacter TaxID=2972488 RepID=UPI002158A4F4|nr:DinB family protein [Paenibacillus radicibacter]MCR8642828.1 DinB family protein [Paenibacillus radicibacter]
MTTSITQTVAQFEETLNHYLQELDKYSLEQLTKVVDEEEWSLGQMYLHLINSANNMQLRNAEECLEQSGNAALFTGEQSEGWQTMQKIGGFPPIAIKVPASPMHTPPQPESKEQIVQGLNTVLVRMKEVAAKLDGADLSYTVAHPRLGPLHALDWFNILEMHYRHHLLQKAKITSSWVTA